MKTTARMTARTAKATGPHWLALGCPARSRPPLRCCAPPPRKRTPAFRSPRPRSSTSSSDLLRSTPTTSSRLFFPPRHIRCRSSQAARLPRGPQERLELRARRGLGRLDRRAAELPRSHQATERRPRLDVRLRRGRVEPTRRRARTRSRDSVTSAYAAGNLRSDDRQTVTREDGAIEIKPADPQVIYVPYYEPEQVVVYQRGARLPLLSVPLPGVLLPVPRALRVRHRLFLGREQLVLDRLALAPRAHLRPHYHSHPYYGWSYYNPWYVRNVYVKSLQSQLRVAARPPLRRATRRARLRRSGLCGQYAPGEQRGPHRRRHGGAARTAVAASRARARRGQAAAARQPRRGVLADPNRASTTVPTGSNTVSRHTRPRAPSPTSTVAARRKSHRARRAPIAAAAACRRRCVSRRKRRRAALPPASRATQPSTGMPTRILTQPGSTNELTARSGAESRGEWRRHEPSTTQQRRRRQRRRQLERRR